MKHLTRLFAIALLLGAAFAAPALAVPPTPPPVPVGLIGSDVPLGYNASSTSSFIPFATSTNGEMYVICDSGCGGGGVQLMPFSGASDAQAAAANQGVGELVFNGTTWDRQREGTVLGSTLVTLGGTLPAFASTPTVTDSLPYSMSAADGTQAATANSGLGMLAFNATSGFVERLQLTSADALITSGTISAGANGGSAVIGTVILQPWTQINVSGSSTGAFGATLCPSGACNKQVVASAGVLGSLVWNSSTNMPNGMVMTCYNSTGVGTIDNELFTASQMSAGASYPLPAGGLKYSTALDCQISGFISTSQTFTFGTH